jgi:hypothetical protein
MNPIKLFGEEEYPVEHINGSITWMGLCGGYRVIITDTKDPSYPKPIRVSVSYFDNDIADDDSVIEHVTIDNAIHAAKRIIYNFITDQNRAKLWAGYGFI